MRDLGRHFAEQDNVDEADRWYCIAAEFGDRFAMLELGEMHEKHGGFDQAVSWYLHADEAEPSAQGPKYLLGNLYRRYGYTGEAASWWLKAAELGLASAMQSLGDLYEEQGDHARATYWWQKAADAVDDTLFW